MKKFPNYLQSESKDCGATCLKIIAKYYGKIIDIKDLRDYTETNREGTNLMSLSIAAEKIGFRTIGAKISVEKLSDINLPCILHWNKSHFVVLYKVNKEFFFISDPAYGLVKFKIDEFLRFWIGNNANTITNEGIILILETAPVFYKSDLSSEKESTILNLNFLKNYLIPYRNLVSQLFIGLFTASLLNLIFPFLTQSIVDVGIQNQNIHFIYLILIAQLFLFIGKIILDINRSWILLHLSTRINISLISDFFIKLMNLPISYFDVKMTGDIMQRINDHQRIERILTISSLESLLSLINMITMGAVLAYYSIPIFFIFSFGSLTYLLWIIIFLKQRKLIDYLRFSTVSHEQSKVIELINGMQEIKLHNAEKQKRWGWEYIQARLFRISMKGLYIEHIQTIGSAIINQLKNIFIIFLSAKLVIDGQITLGMMMAITSIVGSLDGPIAQLINFIREFQDAKISLARLSEIHEKVDETEQAINQTNEVPVNKNLSIKNLCFRYIGSDLLVLKELDLIIPANKITAIVGTSGSGKTTLMKLLLKFYDPTEGDIKIGETSLKSITQKAWRNNIGAVMQEGFIFNDTIANNIAVGVDIVDKDRLFYAADVANINDYIDGLPLGFNTKIGMEGVGMSTGQKQRLLIARAVYKNPEMLFFDEATSALDANNEKEIMRKLNLFFKDKTVVVIAHRLSTVMNADQIVVLEKGKIVETGNHQSLVNLKGRYFELVKNQLQLGN